MEFPQKTAFSQHCLQVVVAAAVAVAVAVVVATVASVTAAAAVVEVIAQNEKNTVYNVYWNC